MRASQLTGRRLHDKLVQGQALSTSLENSSAGSLCESESGDSELGNLNKSLIISHGGDHDNSSVLSLSEMFDKSSE